MKDILFGVEVFAVMGCAMAVHRTFGSGFLEGVYGDTLAVEFRRKGIPFERERRFPILYKGIQFDRSYIADVVCYSQIIVELKAIDFLSKKEIAQLLNYLKETGLRLGLLIDFGSVGKLGWKRMIV